MPQYRPCPHCWANLDSGERCDCQDKKEAAPLARKRPQEKETALSLSAKTEKVNEGRLPYGSQ